MGPQYAPKRIERVATGEIFPSIKQATATVFVTQPSINAALRCGGICRGSRWRYLDQPNVEPHVDKRPRPVEAIDGDRWPSIEVAARALGVSTQAVKQALKKGYRCQGWQLRYVAKEEL